MGVCCAGYPNQGRVDRADGIDEFSLFSGLFVVEDVTPRYAICVFSEDEWVETPHFPRSVSPDDNLGGISGAPLLALAESGGIVSWYLAGVVTNVSDGQYDPAAVEHDYRYLRVAHARFMSRDGHVSPFD